MTHYYNIHIEAGPLASSPKPAESADTQSQRAVASQQCVALEEVQPFDKDDVLDRIAELQRLVAQLRHDIDTVRLEKQESKRQWDVMFALVTEITNLRQRPNRPEYSCANLWY